MTHHEAEAELERIRDEDGTASGQGGAADAVRRARIAEWERITELLADHEGAYDPGTDAFVQGQLTARANRETAEPTVDQAADEAHRALLNALERAGVLDGSGAEQETVAVRLAKADPEAALTVAEWVDTAFQAGRVKRDGSQASSDRSRSSGGAARPY